VESARGLVADADRRNAREALVLAETLREHLLRILTGWIDPTADSGLLPHISRVMQLPAGLSEILFPRQDAFLPAGRAPSPNAQGLDRWLTQVRNLLMDTVFGAAPGDWLSLEGLDALSHWAETSHGAGALHLRDLATQGWQSAGATRVPPLPPLGSGEIAACLDADDDFIAAPQWQGRPCETGAFARGADHPLVLAARETHGDGLLARSLARLVEVASLPNRIEALISGDQTTAQDATRAPGIGQVEAARGRLVHRVLLDGDTVTRYRILAPTEWNFHPHGVVAQALTGLPATGNPRRLAGLLVEAVDPCVGYDLEMDDDA